MITIIKQPPSFKRVLDQVVVEYDGKVYYQGPNAGHGLLMAIFLQQRYYAEKIIELIRDNSG